MNETDFYHEVHEGNEGILNVFSKPNDVYVHLRDSVKLFFSFVFFMNFMVNPSFFILSSNSQDNIKN